MSVFLHVVAAAVWVGGLLFLALVALPVARRFPPQERSRLVALLGRRFLPVAWTALAVLVVTGMLNLALRGVVWESVVTGRLFTGPFGRVLGLKLLLVAAALGLSALHDFVIGPASARAADRVGGDAARALRLRRSAAWIGRANTLLALAIVLLAVMLVRGVP